MSLNWESTYAIALELNRQHPNASWGDLTLSHIQEWTLLLPDFDDDPDLCNDAILEKIFQEWYEVTIHD